MTFKLHDAKESLVCFVMSLHETLHDELYTYQSLRFILYHGVKRGLKSLVARSFLRCASYIPASGMEGVCQDIDRPPMFVGLCVIRIISCFRLWLRAKLRWSFDSVFLTDKSDDVSYTSTCLFLHVQVHCFIIIITFRG